MIEGDDSRADRLASQEVDDGEQTFRLRHHAGSLEIVTEGRYGKLPLSLNILRPFEGHIIPDQCRILHHFQQDFGTMNTTPGTRRYLLEKKLSTIEQDFPNGKPIPAEEMSAVEVRVGEIYEHIQEMITIKEEWEQMRKVLLVTAGELKAHQAGAVPAQEVPTIRKALHDAYVSVMEELHVLRAKSAEQNRLSSRNLPNTPIVFTPEESLRRQVLEPRQEELKAALIYYGAEVPEFDKDGKVIEKPLRNQPEEEVLEGLVTTYEASKLMQIAETIEEKNLPDFYHQLDLVRDTLVNLLKLKSDPRFADIVTFVEESKAVPYIEQILKENQPPPAAEPSEDGGDIDHTEHAAD
jgi:hypothetical protein